jgi:hypothetical protein
LRLAQSELQGVVFVRGCVSDPVALFSA